MTAAGSGRQTSTSVQCELKLRQSVEAIRHYWPDSARVGLILGTGFGHLADFLQTDAEIHFEKIPHFPRATALSHAGHLVCGRLAGIPVAVLRGRCHLYEGYSVGQLTLPVHVLRRLGCETLIVSNAAGGLNPQFAAGDIMLVSDHINLMWTGPVPPMTDGLRPGRQVGEKGAGVDAAGLYDRGLQDQVFDLARREGFALRRGVYVGVTGPMYETRAEYRFLRRIGGDVVGMSTVPEVLAARHCGLRVLALSTVTNVATPDSPQTVSGEEVVTAARRAEPRVRALVMRFLSVLAAGSQAGRGPTIHV